LAPGPSVSRGAVPRYIWGRAEVELAGGHLGALPGRHGQVEEGDKDGAPLQPPVRQAGQPAGKDGLVSIVSN
jgi:hypothetical protein